MIKQKKLLSRNMIMMLICIITLIFMCALIPPVSAQNASNMSNASDLANISYNIEGIFGQGFGTTQDSIFGGEALVVTGIIILLIFGFLALRYSASLDLILPFFISLIVVLGIHGYLPEPVIPMAVIVGGVVFALGALMMLTK